MEVHGQYLAGLSRCPDVPQTISSEEIKNANHSIHTAGNDAEINKSQRFDRPARKSIFLVIRTRIRYRKYVRNTISRLRASIIDQNRLKTMNSSTIKIHVLKLLSGHVHSIFKKRKEIWILRRKVIYCDK